MLCFSTVFHKIVFSGLLCRNWPSDFALGRRKVRRPAEEAREELLKVEN